MENLVEWITPLRADVLDLFHQIIAYLPQLISGVVLLVVGWLVARTLRAVAVHLIGGWDWLTKKLTIGKTVDQAKVRETSASLIGICVYWLTILFFVTAAVNTLDWAMFSSWLNRAILYVPQIISGVLVIVLGYAVSNYAHDAVIRRLGSGTRQQRALLARITQACVIAATFVIGLDLIGVDTSILVTVIGVAVGMFFGGGALAFGLGARPLVTNLLGARFIQRDCRIGDAIRVGTIEGRILRLNPSTVILETPDGQMKVPGKLFLEETSIVLEGDRGHG
jgi:small-conductance mechanosensitive channel